MKNREAWLVFYRTEKGVLSSEEFPVEDYSRTEALAAVGKKYGIERLECDRKVPIVKKLVYTKVKQAKITD